MVDWRGLARRTIESFGQSAHARMFGKHDRLVLTGLSERIIATGTVPADGEYPEFDSDYMAVIVSTNSHETGKPTLQEVMAIVFERANQRYLGHCLFSPMAGGLRLEKIVQPQ